MVTQGQGVTTEFKERGLQAAFTINLKVFNGLNARYNNAWSYFHFDLNCGSGINEEVGCIGSPIAFINAAEQTGCQSYFAGFCDTNETALAKLLKTQQVSESDRCFCFHGDNKSLIDAIPNIISVKEKPSKAMGMILSDPNGSQIPLESLEWLSRECPRIDFCLNWNSTQFKRNRGAFGTQHPTLHDAIVKLNKAHWLIREPMGCWQWTLLIGRNTKIGEHPALGFYNLDSKKGQAIFEKCNYTKGIKPGSNSTLFPGDDLLGAAA